LVAASTRVCINPSTATLTSPDSSEQVCNRCGPEWCHCRECRLDRQHARDQSHGTAVRPVEQPTPAECWPWAGFAI
jgi:hypothetical protein